MEKEREEISIEDLIEKERGNLDTAKLTKGTNKSKMYLPVKNNFIPVQLALKEIFIFNYPENKKLNSIFSS